MADPTDSPSGRRRRHPRRHRPIRASGAWPTRHRTDTEWPQADLAPGPEPAASPGRSTAFGAIAGVAGSAAITVLGSVLTVTAGLLVVAAATGWAVAMGLRVGDGGPRAGGGRVGRSRA